MAFQTIPGGAYLPNYPSLGDNSWGARNFVLDAADEKFGSVLIVPKTGTISKVASLIGAVVTGADLDFRLENVDLATGFPDGTLLGANSNSVESIVSGDAFKRKLATLTTAVAVTKGDIIGFTMVMESGSPGDINVRSFRGNEAQGFPYNLLDSGAGYVKSLDGAPTCSFEYDDGSYDVWPGTFPNVNDTFDTYNNTDTPDDIGLRFKLPFPVRVTGFWLWADLDSDTNIVLQEADDTVLETLSLDKDVRFSTIPRLSFRPFDGIHELSKDVYYRLTLIPTSATDISLALLDLGGAAEMDSVSGGQDFHHTSRKDAGSWTNTLTKRPQIGLIIDAFDDGVQTGGSMAPEGVTQIDLVI